MFRFTIRDVLWLTVVVALAVVLWTNHRRHQEQIKQLDEIARQLKYDGKVWENRASALRNDMLLGRNKNTDIEFVPNGVRYTPKRPPATLIEP